MKKLFLVMFLFASIVIRGQEKIAKDTYLYGELKNCIKGKVVVWYGVDDPKGEEKALDVFLKGGYDVISWNRIFMPGKMLTDSIIGNELTKRNIETVIFIKKTGTSSYTSGSAYALSDSYIMGSAGNVVSSVSIDFIIYSEIKGFDEPLAVIKSKANNNSGILGTERGLIIKIVDRIVSEIKEQNK